MNLSQIFQQFERDRNGRKISAPRRWFSALTVRVTGSAAGKRRPTGRDNRELESLEVRQVLSVTTPVIPSIDVVVSSGNPEGSHCKWTVPTGSDVPADSSLSNQSAEDSADVMTPPTATRWNSDVLTLCAVDGGSNSGSSNHLMEVSDGTGALDDPSFIADIARIHDLPTETQEDFGRISASIDFSPALIDEVFRNSPSLLDDSSLSAASIIPSGSGNYFHGSKQAAEHVGVLFASSSYPVHRAVPPPPQIPFGICAAELPRDKFADFGNLAQVESNGRPYLNASILTAAADSEISRGPDRLSGSPVRDSGSAEPASLAESTHGHANWLMWLTDSPIAAWVSSQESVIASSLSNELFSDAVPLLSERSRPLQVPQATASHAQTFSRKLRENHRQCVVRERVDSVAPDQFEPPHLLEVGSFPRQLKFFVDPRGPPIYGRDADVPFAETNAPADLLERLRYSIAPRGPSLVAVEMQSPEFLSFSGPRMSLKELRFELVG